MEGPRRWQYRSRRRDLTLPVELTFPGTGHRDVVPAQSVNVSETGMLVRSRASRPPGTRVRFDVQRRYGGLGEVAWTRDLDDGMALMGLALGASRHTLIELLEDQRR